MPHTQLKRIFDIVDFQIDHYPNENAFNQKLNMRWRNYSIQEARKIIDSISIYLLSKNYKKGDQAIICTEYSCPQWHFFDLAMMQLGMICIPIHFNSLESDIEYILNELDVKLCILSNTDRLSFIKDLIQCEIISFEESEDAIFWKKTLKNVDAGLPSKLEALKDSILPSDLATIIYTSGSTGKPKGVMLSHNNIVSNIRAFYPLNPVDYRSLVVTYLPISHILERFFCYTFILAGAAIYYIDKPSDILSYCKEVKPHFMTAVPRILEKTIEAIEDNIKSRNLIARKVLNWALHKGTQNGSVRMQGIIC